MTRIICDFETASTVDLKVCGAAVYAEHPNTEILCLVWRREGGNVFGVWSPWLPEYASLDELRELAENPENIFVSHAMFEQFIWRSIMVPLGLPPLPPERWQDTQAVAFWKSLPGALEKLCEKLGLPTQKDMEGRKLTLSLSKPITMADHERRYPGPLWGAKADWKRTFAKDSYDRSRPTIERVIEYCKTDVAGEADLLAKVGDLSPAERKVWLLDQEINHRGIRVDMEFVRAARQVVDKASATLAEEFAHLTGGLKPGQRDRVIEWCGEQGVALDNLQKGYLAELLGSDDDEEMGDAGYESLADNESPVLEMSAAGLPPPVARVLAIRQMLGSASIKKLNRMQHCVGFDGRARGLTQYHAAHPGRWGGRLLQPQNFPRGTGLDPDAACAAILTGDAREVESLLGIPAIKAVASSLRHALVPAPGHVFEVGDFAGIEMRVDLALAGQHDKCDLLATGKDVYLDMACDIYGVPKGSLTKADVEKRTIGKNTVLGCGFQMGAPKFHDRYCQKQPFEFAEQVVKSYREQWAPKVVEMWDVFKKAVTACVAHGRTVQVYGCTFRRDGDFMRIDLPSGWQTIWYYQPAMRPRATARGVEYQPSYKAMKSGKWITVFLYGGIICENIVQALARGLLVSAMGRLTMAGKPLVLTVHDEAICEVPEDQSDIARFKAIMSERPAWAEKMGIPIAVEEWAGTRYKK